MTKKLQQILAFSFGVVFLVVLLVLAQTGRARAMSRT